MTLKEYMVEYSITSREMAKKLKVSISAVRKWIQGIRIPRLPMVQRIHQLTGGKVSFHDWK